MARKKSVKYKTFFALPVSAGPRVLIAVHRAITQMRLTVDARARARAIAGTYRRPCTHRRRILLVPFPLRISRDTRALDLPSLKEPLEAVAGDNVYELQRRMCR